MTFHDKITIPLGNLWRMKLRSFLTISGVMIAIGAFVAMLSFGAGNQKYVTEQYNQLGLLSTMYVYPKDGRESADTLKAAPLNDSVLTWLSTLPGVNLAYPFDSYDVTALALDTALKLKAQSVPSVATQTRMFSQMNAGTTVHFGLSARGGGDVGVSRSLQGQDRRFGHRQVDCRLSTKNPSRFRPGVSPSRRTRSG